jgi:outer membrane protein assembly factor BamD (BamD/ComL family)
MRIHCVALQIACQWVIAVGLSCLAGCSGIQKPSLDLPFVSDETRARVSEKSLAERFKMAFQSPANPPEARRRYDLGENLFQQATQVTGPERKKKFLAAAKEYAAAARYHPSTALAEDALVMSGESFFFADAYPKAVGQYAEVVKLYPNTRHLDRIDHRRFLIAQYWLNQYQRKQSPRSPVNFASDQHPTTDTFGHAVKLLDRIRFDNPTGKLADDATMAAAVANFRRGKYGEADILFTDIRDNFPNSDHQFWAHLFGLKCKQQLYRGADYDGSVLSDSELLIQQMVRVFPEESRKYQDRLQNDLKNVRLQQAERDFALAQYFDDRKEFGAARFYYDLVRQHYRDTNLALESESRLAQIEGEPERPDSHWQWLIDAIPEERPAKPWIARDTVDTIRR